MERRWRKGERDAMKERASRSEGERKCVREREREKERERERESERAFVSAANLNFL